MTAAGPAGQPTAIITEVTVLPAGFPPDRFDSVAFAAHVRWHGPRTATGHGGYGVDHSAWHLNRITGAWDLGRPDDDVLPDYRWADLDGAIAAAGTAVEDLVINGLSVPQWRARWSAQGIIGESGQTTA